MALSRKFWKKLEILEPSYILKEKENDPPAMEAISVVPGEVKQSFCVASVSTTTSMETYQHTNLWWFLKSPETTQTATRNEQLQVKSLQGNIIQPWKTQGPGATRTSFENTKLRKKPHIQAADYMNPLHRQLHSVQACGTESWQGFVN